MAANVQPIFTLVPKIFVAQVSAGNTNRDGTGTVVTVATGAADGTRIHRITVKAAVATTAGMVRLYIYDGTNTRLWMEVSIPASGSLSATVQGVSQTIELFGERALVLPQNYELRASTHNAEAINVIAEGGNY